MSVRARVLDAFRFEFGSEPSFIARAPGRVNLIGEHTDYNDGFVLPLAINREINIALRPRSDWRIVLQSIDFGKTEEFSLESLERGEQEWIEYVKGVAWVLAEAGLRTAGWEGVIGGDVPRGAGLSSSAALELAAMRAFAAVSDWTWQANEAALLGRRVENEWIGVNSGIMDQMIVAHGQADHALLIDCRTLETEAVPLPTDATIVVLDTGTRRGLVDSAYNERRAQCEAAAAVLGVAALRDVDSQTLFASADRLDEVTLRRARHVVTENERTLQTVLALRAADLERVGDLMNASHASLRADFEVTNDALDHMATSAQLHPACYGARMTGAGFGGCAVALVDPAQLESFMNDVTQRYYATTGLTPHAYACRAAKGASVENFNQGVFS
ncbi:MAG TPA: galactokinase [Longimicrobiales bacterium]|nr:galactokinase [Longimicrobiales bacterium]